MVAAIILAAGESTRLEGPKALLPFESKTFIRCVVDSLIAGGLSPIVVVLGAHAEVIQPEVAGSNVHVITNHGYRAGQLSSLQRGLEVVREGPATGVLVHPVDHPAVKAETVKALLKYFTALDGMALADAGRTQEAVSILLEALRIDKQNPGTFSYLGNLYAIALGEPAKALPYFKEAVVLNPDAPDGHLNLANTYALLGDYEKAIHSFRREIYYHPGSAAAFFNLGRTYSLMGEEGLARRAFGRASRIGSSQGRVRRE